MSFLKAIADLKPQGLESLPSPDAGLLASGAVIFGVQRLVPSYDDSWYKAIQKPTWTPPNWVFPAVWIPLKAMQTYALWLVIKQAPDSKALALPLSLFGAHLALGNVWNVVFFGRRQLQPSLKYMAAFWATLAGSIAAWHPVSPVAAALLVPTQVWVTVAAKLNHDIVKLNEGAKAA